MKNKYGLLIVDMLNEFVTGALGSEEAKGTIKPNKELIDYAHKNNIPVIYTCDSHFENIDFEFTKWGAHAIKGDKASEIVPQLKPSKEDYVLYKRRYDAFFHTDLDLLLKELNINTLIITGVQTHICVQHSVGGAFMSGIKTILASEATKSPSIEDYEKSIKYMKDIYGTIVLDNKELLKYIEKH